MFWAAVLGWAVVYDEADGALVADSAGGYPQLYLQPVPEPKAGKNRVMWTWKLMISSTRSNGSVPWERP